MGNTRDQERYNIGQNIRHKRREKEYSQESLAEAMGISSMTLYRIENGKTALCMEYLIKLSQILDTPVESFLKVRDENEESVV